MSAGRFRFLGKVFPLEALQQWWDHNWRQAEKDIQNLETGATGGAVLLAGRTGGQTITGTTSDAYLASAPAAATPPARFYAEGSANNLIDSQVRVNNTNNTGTAAGGSLTALATAAGVNQAVTQVNAWNAGVTTARWGLTLALWSEIFHNSGNGLVIGTVNNTPVVFGTNSTERARIDTFGNLLLQTAGAGLRVKEGTNCRMGVATLVAGAVTVNTTAVTANSRIFLSGQTTSGAGLDGELTVSARTAGTSFTILSANGGDVRVVAWLLVEPA